MKGVVIHALLAVFGLVFAYQTYTRKPEEETIPGGVTVAECSRDAVTKLSLNTATVEVVAEPVHEGGETAFWITTRHRPPEEVTSLDPNKNPSKHAASGDAAGAGADQAEADQAEAGAHADADNAEEREDHESSEDKPKSKPAKLSEANRPKRFLANEKFDGYLRRLTPVRALRSLGKLNAKRDEDFGFGKVLGFLELECAGHTLELQSGSRAFGSGQRYLKDTKTGVTYLFDEPTISDLESAQFKFMQSDLHRFKPADVEEVVVEAQGAKRKLLQRDRKLPKAQWVDEAEPTKRNELYNNWFARLARLRARAYLKPGAEPGSDLGAAGSATPVLKLNYKVEDQPKASLELVRVDENGVGHYYARTETTRSWVALFDSAAKDVEQDVGMVVGVEQPSPQSQDKPAQKSANEPATGRTTGESSPNERFLPAGHPRVPAGH